MEYGLFLALGCGFIAGAVGGLLIGWSSLRRLLAIEEWLKVKDFAYEARFKEIERRYLTEEKRSASETRWTGNKKKIEEDASKLLELTSASPVGHPWDPRTWGKGGN